jgi:putative phosphoribosyl transferase
MQRMIFENRTDAGKQLAAKLMRYAGAQTRILALPRGGVPVAFEVAIALHAPLDVFIVRKLGAPGREELAIGAIASGDVRVLNDETIALLGIDDATIETITQHELEELRRRERAYRDDLPAQDVTERTVILIDDGLATGASMQAAVIALRRRSPREIIVAVPLAPAETCALLARYTDDILCLAMPQPFRGVGAWYADFRQVSDDEVRALLIAAAEYEKAAHHNGRT